MTACTVSTHTYPNAHMHIHLFSLYVAKYSFLSLTLNELIDPCWEVQIKEDRRINLDDL